VLDITQKIEGLIKKAGQDLGFDFAAINIEHPDDITHGDYSTNVALAYSKFLGKSPREISESLKTEIEKSLPKEISKIEVAGAGFINFFLSREFFTESIGEIINDENFGKNKIGEGKKVVVEYSSPNIAKPFTVGHLRSTIIGDAIANIISNSGYEVVRDNHLGDWGTQFGKQIVAIEKWGSIKELKESSAPMRYLVDLYVKFHEEAESDEAMEDGARKRFKDLESGEQTALDIYNETIKVSKEYFNSIYWKLGVNKFDTELGESFYGQYIEKITKELEDKKLLKLSEGATLVFFEEDKLPPLMIKKTDGTTLYATRDLATDLYRLETYGKDTIIVNEVGGEQSLYFKQIFETEKLLGWVNDDQRIHVAHGLYRFKEGKMSTRKGNVIWLEEVIDEATKRAEEINKETSKDVAIGALKFNDLKRRSSEDIVFDWDEILNLKGDSGPYLQYSYVRAYSIIEKADGANIKISFDNVLDGVTNLEKILYRFPEVTLRAGQEYSPHHIATYLMELASAFSNFYAQGVIVSDSPEASYKVAITKAFSIVMKRGLEMLGIPVLTRM
jgi:arginyl-tRNA synthetase